MEDPQIISALISAQQASIATIEAAKWTAGATLVGAVVGAVGIFFAAWFAWRSGIELHKHNNILQAKREIYIDAVCIYPKLIGELQNFAKEPSMYKNKYNENLEKLSIALMKIQIICNESNKEFLNLFSIIVRAELLLVIVRIDSFVFLLQELEVKKNQLDGIRKIINDYNKKIFEEGGRLDIDIFDKNIDHEKELTEKYDILNEKVRTESALILNSITESDEKILKYYSKFTKILRNELC